MNLNPNSMIQPMYVDGMPIGSIVAYGSNAAPPSGWLWLRKAKLKKTTYALLYGVLGDVFNDGSQAADEFMVPDAEGYFLRNFDNGGTVDPGRVFGSKQADALQGHRHAPPVGKTHFLTNPGDWNASAGGTNGAYLSGAATGDPVTDTVNGAPRTANETRPKNIALNYIIKASVVYTQQQLMAAGSQYVPNAATESTDGVVKLATQAEVNAGNEDFKVVTPKKLRLGFAFQALQNGYVIFPSWLGGFIIQWGIQGTNSAGDSVIVFPTAYPQNALFIIGQSGSNQIGAYAYSAISLSGATIPCFNTNTAVKAGSGTNVVWLSVGR